MNTNEQITRKATLIATQKYRKRTPKPDEPRWWVIWLLLGVSVGLVAMWAEWPR